MVDYKYGFNGMTREQMVSKMTKGWKSSETPCGRGSELGSTRNVENVLRTLIEEHDIKILNDAGAGDLHWMRFARENLRVDYYPFDLVPRHPDVTRLDITSEVMPYADMILCRHVLNHLSGKLALDAMDNFVQSESRFLLMTMAHNQEAYWDYCNMKLRPPIQKFNDVGKWWLELHDLQREDGLWERRQ